MRTEVWPVMSEGSPIGWLHMPGHEPVTANIVIGCTPRSTGCLNCYAPRWVARQAHYPGRDGIVEKNDEGLLEWTGKILTFPGRLAALRRTRKPCMVFVTSLGELFDVQVDEEEHVQLWETMKATPQHTYVILSKLAKRMHDVVTRMVKQFEVLPNVWLGVSIENQEQANIRVPWLLRTPAAIRAVSCEPLLGPIDLRSIPYRGDTDYLLDALHGRYRRPGTPATDGWGTTAFPFGMANLGVLNWVIVGGESGRKDRVRAMHPDWARNLIAQAKGARVAAFFKQHGNWAPAPWVVRVPDDVIASGDEDRIEAAKDHARRVGATHYYNDLAHLYDHQITEAGHAPFSVERHELAPGEPNAPMRFYPNKSAGHELYPGVVVQQWPSTGGQIISAEPREEVPAHV